MPALPPTLLEVPPPPLGSPTGAGFSDELPVGCGFTGPFPPLPPLGVDVGTFVEGGFGVEGWGFVSVGTLDDASGTDESVGVELEGDGESSLESAPVHADPKHAAEKKPTRKCELVRFMVSQVSRRTSLPR